MLSRPGFYDGARPNPETERRAPEMGQSRQARLGREKKSSGSIMAPIAADSQVCCSLWSVLLLVSTFWPKPDVPCAEQQAPLQFLVPGPPSRPGAVSGWVPRCMMTGGRGGVGGLVGGGEGLPWGGWWWLVGGCRRGVEAQRSTALRLNG